MQKQIFEFPTVNVPLPSDLFLISHSGMTANMSLGTVASFANSLISSNINTLNANVSRLSALEHLDSVSIGSNVLTLSADVNSLKSENFLIRTDIQRLSSLEHLDVVSIESNVLTLSADINSLINENLLLNTSFLSLSSLEKLDVSSLESNILLLSASVQTLNEEFNTLSALDETISTDLLQISSHLIQTELNVLSLSSNFLSLNEIFIALSAITDTNSLSCIMLSENVFSLSALCYALSSVSDISTIQISELSSGSSLLSAWVDSLDFSSPTNPTIQLLQSQIDTVSAYADNLSAWVDSLDFSSITNPVIMSLRADVEYLSAVNDSISLSISSLGDTLSADIVSLSAYYLINFDNVVSLSADYLLNYNNVLFLSADVVSLSANFVELETKENSLAVTVDLLSATGILDSYIKFSPDEIHGRGTLTISPSSNLLIQTSDSINTKIWSFDSSGQLTLPGNLIFSVDPTDGGPYTSPVELDVTLSVQKLNSGIYNLPDGVEGQIMYFVPKSNSVGDTSTQVYISNARYWIIDGLGHKLAVTSSIYWVPWILHDHRLDPVYDIMPTITTAIFTDGAWNISTGGRD